MFISDKRKKKIILIKKKKKKIMNLELTLGMKLEVFTCWKWQEFHSENKVQWHLMQCGQPPM